MKIPDWLFYGLVSLLAVICGAASAAWIIRGTDNEAVASGPWRATLLAGSETADATTRARVAVGGLLALSRGETLYYVARQDSAGLPLDGRCEYRVSGKPPQARWWSVTAYASDHFLIPGADGHHSVNGSQVVLDDQGNIQIRTGPDAGAQDGSSNALRTPHKAAFLLTLRLYNPQDSLQRSPAALEPLRIERAGEC